jgi:hypothetical protein
MKITNEPKNTRKTSLVPCSSLLFEPGNPPDRTAKGPALAALMLDMHAKGQQTPIEYSPATMIVEDGNRRLAAARALGWSVVECIPMRAHGSFSTLNGNRKTITTAQYLKRYVDGFEVPDRLKSSFDAVERTFGDGTLSFLAEHRCATDVTKVVHKLHSLVPYWNLSDLLRMVVSEGRIAEAHALNSAKMAAGEHAKEARRRFPPVRAVKSAL